MSQRAVSIRACVRLLALVGVMSPSAPARAQEATPSASPSASPPASAAKRLAAEELFEAARRDLRAGRTAEACPKLEESQRLDPGLGTLLHLGECHERLGRTASAWTAFRDALPLARATGDAARARLAQERADALLPRLARVVIEPAAAARPAGLALTLDGAPFPEARWGVSVPLNPGPHRVRAEAPAHREQSFDVLAEANKTTTLTIPALAHEGGGQTAQPPPRSSAEIAPPSPAPFAPTPPPRASAASPDRWTTLSLVGATTSGLTLVVGGAFGFRALRAWNDSRPYCDAENACDPPGLAAIDRARSSATIATALLATGAAVGAATAVLVLSASPRTPRVALGPSGISLGLTWK